MQRARLPTMEKNINKLASCLVVYLMAAQLPPTPPSFRHMLHEYAKPPVGVLFMACNNNKKLIKIENRDFLIHLSLFSTDSL